MVKVSNYVSEFLVPDSALSALSAWDFADTGFACNRLIFQVTRQQFPYYPHFFIFAFIPTSYRLTLLKHTENRLSNQRRVFRTAVSS
jgi:hypothetical protein